jgi:hypothetical protein
MAKMAISARILTLKHHPGSSMKSVLLFLLLGLFSITESRSQVDPHLLYDDEVSSQMTIKFLIVIGMYLHVKLPRPPVPQTMESLGPPWTLGGSRFVARNFKTIIRKSLVHTHSHRKIRAATTFWAKKYHQAPKVLCFGSALIRGGHTATLTFGITKASSK